MRTLFVLMFCGALLIAEEVGLLARLQEETRVIAAAADQALVAVSVRALQGPRFVQQFALSRAADQAPWRIDHIDQRGVVAANLKAAVVAFPNIEHQRRLRPAASN